MLRFRPIAPKPVTGGNISGHSPQEKNETDYFMKSRPKRKYIRSKKKKAEIGNDEELDQKALNQQLSTGTEGSGSNPYHDIPMIEKFPMCLDFDGTGSKQEKSLAKASTASDLTDQSDLTPRRRKAESLITVECVTDGCMDGELLTATDIEIIKYLDVDTCPAFVSDGGHTVQWINLAYRDMVAGGGGESTAETAVQLVVKTELPGGYPASFACRVRVEYTWRKGRCSRIIPSDVWKMEFGGFAWRLDVKAALSLGR